MQFAVALKIYFNRSFKTAPAATSLHFGSFEFCSNFTSSLVLEAALGGGGHGWGCGVVGDRGSGAVAVHVVHNRRVVGSYPKQCDQKVRLKRRPFYLKIPTVFSTSVKIFQNVPNNLPIFVWNFLSMDF